MGDIGMLKGGLLAWLLWQGGVVGDVVVLSRINFGLRVYWGRRGGRNRKYEANKASQKYNKAKRGVRGDLTRYEVVPVKGGNIQEKYPRCLAFSGK